MWWLLLACAPGTIQFPQGEDQLRTALYTEFSDGDADGLFIFLANSDVPCSLPTITLDPEEVLRANLALAAALTRENARAVLIELYRYSVPDWLGYFPLVETPSPSLLDRQSPRVAGASYLGINEAEAVETDGLYRLYEAVDADYHDPVPEPGQVHIRKEGDRVVGTFHLDSIDVAGTFRAKHCESVEVLQALNLVDAFVSAGSSDTGE